MSKATVVARSMQFVSFTNII